MKFNKLELITALQKKTTTHIEYGKCLKTLSEEILNKRVKKDSWSILECIEHLNLYAKFYNLEIEKSVERAIHSNEQIFKSGYLGNKSALSMLPGESLKAMKTFKSKNPIYRSLNKEQVLNDFITHQEKLFDLLEKSKSKNLNKIKTKLTLPFLKFRLGDTFRFVIFHNERHIEQAKRVLKSMS